MFDICVVGSGPAGLMAAISASYYGCKTILIERNNVLAKKMSLSGGGRCNVTNRKDIKGLIENIPGNGKFLYSSFSQFSSEDLINFFNYYGVELKEEDHNRMFPISNKSKSIIDCLTDILNKQNVEILFNSKVDKLLIENNIIKGVSINNKIIKAKKVIIACGGASYHNCGSDGNGYQLAKQANHTITDLIASEAPLISDNQFILNNDLMGLSLNNIELCVIDKNNKIINKQTDDIIFTHFGISGPAALKSSMFVNKLLKKQQFVEITINSKPNFNKDDYFNYFNNHQSKKAIKNALKGLFNERYLIFLLKKANIDINKPFNQVSKNQLNDFINYAMQLKIKITKSWPLEKAFVTCGGISIKEINPKTMESKLCKNLFFAGEIIDINGYTGGYNITAAMSTGVVSGTHAALD